MKLSRLVTMLAVIATLCGCATAMKTINTAAGSLAGNPRYGPAQDLKYKKEQCKKKRAKYYQDAKGLRPNLPSSIGKARAEIVEIFGLDKEPAGIAAFIYSTSCADGAHKKEWTRDKAGAKAYFKEYKALAKEQLRLKARDYAFFLAVNWQTKGNANGLKAIEGNRVIRQHEYNAKKQLNKLQEKLASFDACPHAPSGFSVELMELAKSAYDAEFERLNKFLDMRLMENIKGNKMAPDLRHVKKSDKRAYKKLIPPVIAYDWGSDVKIKAIRFVDKWHTENKKYFNNNTWTHIFEDYTRINVYLDLGADRPYFKCAALDGIKNRLARGRKSVKGARNYGFCESIPK